MVFLMIKLCDVYCFFVYFYYGLIKKYGDDNSQNVNNLVESVIEIDYDAKLESLGEREMSFEIDERVKNMKGSLKNRMKKKFE